MQPSNPFYKPTKEEVDKALEKRDWKKITILINTDMDYGLLDYVKHAANKAYQFLVVRDIEDKMRKGKVFY